MLQCKVARINPAKHASSFLGHVKLHEALAALGNLEEEGLAQVSGGAPVEDGVRRSCRCPGGTSA